jgi:hypothetical protein
MRKGLTRGPVVDALLDGDAEWDRLTLSPLASVLRPLFPERQPVRPVILAGIAHEMRDGAVGRSLLHEAR